MRLNPVRVSEVGADQGRSTGSGGARGGGGRGQQQQQQQLRGGGGTSATANAPVSHVLAPPPEAAEMMRGGPQGGRSGAGADNIADQNGQNIRHHVPHTPVRGSAPGPRQVMSPTYRSLLARYYGHCRLGNGN